MMTLNTTFRQSSFYYVQWQAIFYPSISLFTPILMSAGPADIAGF
jgi:hypothetical protein